MYKLRYLPRSWNGSERFRVQPLWSHRTVLNGSGVQNYSELFRTIWNYLCFALGTVLNGSGVLFCILKTHTCFCKKT
jgi:hypothetical protein